MVSAADQGHFGDHTNDGWAQAGYLQVANVAGYHKGIAFYTQYTAQCKMEGDCSTNPLGPFRTYYPPLANPVVGSVHRFTEQQEDDQEVGMYIDGVEYDLTGYYPSDYWDYRWRGEFEGETFHNEDDMPGTSLSDSTLFEELYYKDINQEHNSKSFTSPAGRTLA